ncbi:MAG: argininosuccinate lyase [Kiritimatiellae bacterium]|nr:argininosuccinate lyase [Kiritimatiellia bacterium]
MKKKSMRAKAKKTTVGMVDADVLAYTAGDDVRLDAALVEADCLGSAAHAIMLSRIPIKPRLFTRAECRSIQDALRHITESSHRGAFRITVEDQDVHLAIERVLTKKLGVLGKRIHTGRSRNDQVATALRLYGKSQLMDTIKEAADLAAALLDFATRHSDVPMVGRTHLQPAMPGSVGLWAAAFAEGLLEDIVLLINAYELNDQSPLGAAASYGVPLPLDREMTADLLGFSRPCHTVLYAIMARGKMESIILSALAQVMLTLSRLAEDLILFTMPEFNYFKLPAEYCTGSSIMPQKQNPDVLELVRAKTARVLADAHGVCGIMKNMASGYNRDLQETKEPFMKGFDTTRSTLRILRGLLEGLAVNEEALLNGFTPEVYATDWALDLVAGGMPFRDAYDHVKQNLHALEQLDPREVIQKKQSLGATGRLELESLYGRMREALAWTHEEQREFAAVYKRLLGISR